MTQEEVNLTLQNIYEQIKSGILETAWEVYDEFENQLTNDTRK